MVQVAVILPQQTVTILYLAPLLQPEAAGAVLYLLALMEEAVAVAEPDHLGRLMLVEQGILQPYFRHKETMVALLPQAQQIKQMGQAVAGLMP